MICLRATLVALSLAGTAAAADWPQWLGPDRDGRTPEKVQPWKGKLKGVWSRPVGEGNSSPVVADGRVYLHYKDAGKLAETLTCYDGASGEVLWSKSYPRPKMDTKFGNGPRATPTIAGGKVYTFGITGILTCFDATSGEQLWQVDTQKEFDAPKLMFGASCSPLVVGDRVLVNVGAKGASVVAFDAATGKVAWQSLDDGASYSSPVAFEQGGVRQAVFLTQQGLVSLDPATGKLFWRYPFRDLILESSTTPVRAGDFLIGSSITKGTVALDLTAPQGAPAAKKAWLNSSLTSYFSTPVPVGKGYLYLVTGVNPLTMINPLAKQNASASVHCVDLDSGKALWKKEGVGKYHASLTATGDGKLLLLEEKGDLVLLNPSPKEYREVARAAVCGETWAHPAVSGGRLYIRDRDELKCVELPTSGD